MSALAVRSLHRAALALAALPMVLGGVVLGAWIVTQWRWLVPAGLVVIGLGMAILVVVPILLAVAWHRDVRSGGAARPRLVRTLAIGAVLLANLPACAGAMSTAMVLQARFTVTLRNDADDAWTGIVLEGGGVRVAWPSLAPAAAACQHLWFEKDGVLVLKHDGAPEVLVEGYVTRGIGGDVTVVRARGGTVTVVRGSDG